jgi:hypothetical protein
VPPLRRKVPRLAPRLRAGLLCLAMIAIALPTGTLPSSALPIPKYPQGIVPTEAPEATPVPAGSVLPFDSSLFFVLDDTLSSATGQANQIVRVHLKDPLVLRGVTVAPAGTPAAIKITDVHAAQSGDEYGYIDIYFLPMTLPNGQLVPLRAPVSHLNVHVSAGHESTVDMEDMAEDIIFPAAILLQVFRKGRNFTLQTGSLIRARAEATISVTDRGAIAVQTPPPLRMPADPPATDFSKMPLAKPWGSPPPHGHATPEPTPAPTATPTTTPPPAATPSASASPSPAPAAS